MTTSEQRPVYVLIPAAGTGSRMQADRNKPFIEIAGVPVIVRTLRVLAAHPRVTGIIVVAADGEIDAMQQLIYEYALPKVLAVTAGGPTRQHSVIYGIDALAAQARDLDDSLVLVHDGARCFVTADVIDRVIVGIEQHQACGAAVPVKDTIKRAAPDGRVLETLDRAELWAMQTPQGANYPLLRAAYDRALTDGWQTTDDLSVLEQAGTAVHLVVGDNRNIKLTTPEDRLLGEKLAE